MPILIQSMCCAALLLAIAAAVPVKAQTATPRAALRNAVATLAAGPQTFAPASPDTSPGAAAAPPAGGSGPGSQSAPAWLMCPPSGASGVAPFLAGTELSCAP